MSIKDELIAINKQFHDGTVRYEGELDGILDSVERLFIKEPVLFIAKRVATHHPFVDANKRTAIKYAEIKLKEKVPDFVYYILDF